MKLNFCTLFNSNYLSRGMVMYESLLKNCDHFHLYIFAFDEVSYNYLNSRTYDHLTVISLKEFEDTELLKIKSTRSAGEYCWTCSSSTILYSINTFGLDNCTYLDADMQFFSNPKVLIDEMGDNSVMITEHRYTKEYDQSAESGKYCVQFVTFKNDARGMNVLNWWRDRCIEWCYGRVEDGKFGDQKYLDDWTTRFEGVHELRHLGGGIAPWNVQQYEFHLDNGKLKGKEIETGNPFNVVFFHFHGVKFYSNDIVQFSPALYDLTNDIKTFFYVPYVKALNKIREQIPIFDSNGTGGMSPAKPVSIILILRFYIHDLRKSLKNILGQNVKNRVNHHYFYYSKKL